MLKIAQLRNVLHAAEQAYEDAIVGDAPAAEVRKLEKAMRIAHDVYAAEQAHAAELKAKYEAMGDDRGVGECNAGDTLVPEYGDACFRSSEYWQLAIDSYQLMLDTRAL
jgi:hypothetical protein